MKILVTGASGFIGSYIVEESLRRGWDTWAAVRPSSSRKFLQDERINFVNIDFSSEDKIVEALRGHDFDYVVHAAGVTKALKEETFYKVNTDGTRNLVNAILRLGMPLKKFVYMSSLSIFGPIREQRPYKEICNDDKPQPNTAYGRSKIKAEEFLNSVGTERLPYVILRPTGVYGPRERDYYLMFQSIERHMDFAAGFVPQDITFVYVTDVVQAVMLALEKGPVGHHYFLSDGKVYSSKDFSNLIHEELGRPWWIRVTAPLWLLRAICFFGELSGKLTGKLSALNNDKYNIMRQRNWRCDITPAIEELGYEPKVGLREGVSRATQWYKENNWL